MRKKDQLLECKEFVEMVLDFVYINKIQGQILNQKEAERVRELLQKKGFIAENVRHISIRFSFVDEKGDLRFSIREQAGRSQHSSFTLNIRRD